MFYGVQISAKIRSILIEMCWRNPQSQVEYVSGVDRALTEHVIAVLLPYFFFFFYNFWYPRICNPFLLSPMHVFVRDTWYVPKETRGEHANSTQKGPLNNPTFLGVGTDDAELCPAY